MFCFTSSFNKIKSWQYHVEHSSFLLFAFLNLKIWNFYTTLLRILGNLCRQWVMKRIKLKGHLYHTDNEVMVTSIWNKISYFWIYHHNLRVFHTLKKKEKGERTFTQRKHILLKGFLQTRYLTLFLSSYYARCYTNYTL